MGNDHQAGLHGYSAGAADVAPSGGRDPEGAAAKPAPALEEAAPPAGDSVGTERERGQRIPERIERGREKAAEAGAGGGRGRGRVPGLDGLRILGRIAVFFVVVAVAYAVVREISYLLFAPSLEMVRPVLPEGPLASGELVTLGVVVKNEGRMEGASFVVAALGAGVEVEGPTLEVAPGDSALIPVRIALGPGENVLSLIVFDGWRGVRRLETLRGLSIRTGIREIAAGEIVMPERATRGERITLTLPWSNPGMVPETVVPMVVFRPEGGGPPLPAAGEASVVEARQARTLVLEVDTWPLSSGSYSAEVLVVSEAGERVGRASSRRRLEVSEP